MPEIARFHPVNHRRLAAIADHGLLPRIPGELSHWFSLRHPDGATLIATHRPLRASPNRMGRVYPRTPHHRRLECNPRQTHPKKPVLRPSYRFSRRLPDLIPELPQPLQSKHPEHFFHFHPPFPPVAPDLPASKQQSAHLFFTNFYQSEFPPHLRAPSSVLILEGKNPPAMPPTLLFETTPRLVAKKRRVGIPTKAAQTVFEFHGSGFSSQLDHV